MKTDKLMMGLIIILFVFAFIPFIAILQGGGWWGSSTVQTGYSVLQDTLTVNYSFYANSPTFVVNSQSRKVGIGTINPSASLHLYSTTSENPVFILENVNDDTAGTVFKCKKSSTTADNDDIAQWGFYGFDSADNETLYGYMIFEARDVTNGDEAGRMRFYIKQDNADKIFLSFSGYEGSVGQGWIILNEGAIDVNTRISAVGETDAIFVEGSSGNVGIGDSTPDAKFDVEGDAIIKDSMTVEGGYIYGDNTSNPLKLVPTSSQDLRSLQIFALSWANQVGIRAGGTNDSGNIRAMSNIITNTNQAVNLGGASNQFGVSHINYGIFYSSVTIGNYKFPWADGSNTQVLTTNGSGVLSWTTQSGGGGGASTLAVEVGDVQVTSPTASIDFDANYFNVTAAGTEANITLDYAMNQDVTTTSNPNFYGINASSITCTYGVNAATGVFSGTVEAGTLTEGGNAVYSSGETPGGELGGTFASFTIDDNVTVTGWTMGASVATTPAADDADTSLATTAFCETTQDYLKTSELAGAETDPNVDTESEIEAITGAFFGASKAVTAGYIWVADGTDFESVIMSGDITIAAGGATTIGANKVQVAELDISSVSAAIAGDIAEGELTDQCVVTADIKEGTILVGDMAANSIDSAQYVDGSIDAVHLAADIIDETKIADNGIDSEHYNDNSIDFDHINWPDITHSFGVYISTCTASENIPTKPFAYAITIGTITAICQTGTATIDVFFRPCIGSNDPFDTGTETDVLTGTISANATAMQGASGFADATIPADNVLVIKTSAQTTNPNIWIRFEYTID